MAKTKAIICSALILVISVAELYAESQPASKVELAQLSGALVSKESQIRVSKEKELDEQQALKMLASKETVSLDEIEMKTKTLSGEVSARGPSGIALVYEKNDKKRASKEMWFPYEVEIELAGYKGKSEIAEGDMVTVTYDEAEDGSKRILTGIKLDKKYDPPKEEDEGEESDE
ncbi:MAG: hypothetical protein HY587_02065 [Candidatus Omnitrophica bacterium]|nr:hypothetical protein [Candidatus Omnitrophota bacterium]